MFTGDGGCVDAGEFGGLGVFGAAETGAVLTGGGNTTSGTGFARLTAARWGVILVCCCGLRGGYGAFRVFLDEEILVTGFACCYNGRARELGSFVTDSAKVRSCDKNMV